MFGRVDKKGAEKNTGVKARMTGKLPDEGSGNGSGVKRQRNGIRAPPAGEDKGVRLWSAVSDAKGVKHWQREGTAGRRIQRRR